VGPAAGAFVIGAAATVVDGIDGIDGIDGDELAVSFEHADSPIATTAVSAATAPVLY
jgi:hypothetical protein